MSSDEVPSHVHEAEAGCIGFPEDIIEYTDKMYSELGAILEEKYAAKPNEFLFNLLSIFNQGVITYKQTGFAAYMPVLYGIDWEEKRKIKYTILREDYSIMNEMTNLIKAQRAYEMNSKVMGIADQMLQTVNNIR